MGEAMENTALVAMSGGVDSSVAAYLTLRAGYVCTGAMMRLYSNEDAGLSADSGCCSLADAQDARAVADLLGIPFYVFNFMDDFASQVIDRFMAAYAQGRTPNPCIGCNRFLKFGRFLRRAEEMNLDHIVTGHYARVAFEPGGGRYLLKKGVDGEKDQSYVLYAMTQEQLRRTLLPIGELRKDEVRQIAGELGFQNAKKRESQDICFVPDGDYAAFIQRRAGKTYPPGPFVDGAGRTLGEHRGIIRYTVGQRRGLGISAPSRLYVRETRPADNTVVLGGEGELYTDTLLAKDLNLIAMDRIDGALKVRAKVRYRQREQDAVAVQVDEDTLRLTFAEPQRAVTPGQAVALYDGDVVLGGGTIVGTGRTTN